MHMQLMHAHAVVVSCSGEACGEWEVAAAGSSTHAAPGWRHRRTGQFPWPPPVWVTARLNFEWPRNGWASASPIIALIEGNHQLPMKRERARAFFC